MIDLLIAWYNGRANIQIINRYVTRSVLKKKKGGDFLFF